MTPACTPRPGFAFATRFRVRYAEIDGQKVVFNSRYLEYADVAATEFWEWTGIAEALGPVWTETEFHVRRSEVDYLKPFVWGDSVVASVRIDRIGGSSLTQRYELAHADTGDLHAVITMVIVNVHLPTGRPVPIADPVRAFLEVL
ncbi:4-hydroxybenzoyl-CoA thioesterase [Sphingomonas sp. Leaf17]|uniref:acyl-CoA thioesterase n=1 Tax=Sphingomonas sp. Leaf17 TaxID=1735683 RepID=UPI000701540D|nr:thioesterase family protein [Sphingomonas sp. Leaf17]KQM67585.1 4-hydroxybenzoyl-CoA thioesterase [Sphingomonas sp. Leaf17]